jgi:hypothetical protein
MRDGTANRELDASQMARCGECEFFQDDSYLPCQAFIDKDIVQSSNSVWACGRSPQFGIVDT